MIFTETSLPGVFLIDLELISDSRGFFARSWCHKEFEEQDLCSTLKQMNTAFNEKTGTLRGLHYQVEPFEEAKVVRCVSGAVFDVAVDMRRSSPTYLNWIGQELSADNRRSLYIPEGFAHGYQTLAPMTELHYLVSEFYSPSAEIGIRFDDPAIAIEWPSPPQIISDKDRSWRLLNTRQ